MLVFRDITWHCITGWLIAFQRSVLLLCSAVSGAKKNAKTGDKTGPFTQRCSITSLKISGIVTCPCLHGQFTEVQKCWLSIVYINFCFNINFCYRKGRRSCHKLYALSKHFHITLHLLFSCQLFPTVRGFIMVMSIFCNWYICGHNK